MATTSSPSIRRPDGADPRARLAALDPGRRARLGQGFVEYGLILSLSALLAVILLVAFGPTVSAVLEVIGDAIDAAS